jgi:hypothetical protein
MNWPLSTRIRLRLGPSIARTRLSATAAGSLSVHICVRQWISTRRVFSVFQHLPYKKRDRLTETLAALPNRCASSLPIPSLLCPSSSSPTAAILSPRSSIAKERRRRTTTRRCWATGARAAAGQAPSPPPLPFP